MSNVKLPLYASLTPKQRQWVHMGLGGFSLVAVFLAVSTLLGGDPMAPSKSAPAPPAVKSLGAVPGESVDPQAAWIGGAGKTITTLQADLLAQQQKQDRVNQDLLRELEDLRRAKAAASTPSAVPGAVPPPLMPKAEEGGRTVDEPFARFTPNAASPAPQRRPGPQSTSSGYPPGQPLNPDPQPALMPLEPSAGLVKVNGIYLSRTPSGEARKCLMAMEGG